MSSDENEGAIIPARIADALHFIVDCFNASLNLHDGIAWQCDHDGCTAAFRASRDLAAHRKHLHGLVDSGAAQGRPTALPALTPAEVDTLWRVWVDGPIERRVAKLLGRRDVSTRVVLTAGSAAVPADAGEIDHLIDDGTVPPPVQQTRPLGTDLFVFERTPLQDADAIAGPREEVAYHILEIIEYAKAHPSDRVLDRVRRCVDERSGNPRGTECHQFYVEAGHLSRTHVCPACRPGVERAAARKRKARSRRGGLD